MYILTAFEHREKEAGKKSGKKIILISQLL